MIALDGADAARLERGSLDGSLPNLARLRARGVVKPMSAPVCATDDSMWASFQYGVEPSEHGRYHYLQQLPNGRFDMAHHLEAGRERFWDSLSEAGQRIAVLDVPKCPSPTAVNGIHLTDWLVHGRYFHDAPRSYPAALADDVLSRFGPAPPSTCGHAKPAVGDDGVAAMALNLSRSLAQKRAAGLHYLAAEAWDLFIVGFKEAHCAGHAFWDLTDPHHPDHDPARCARLGDPLGDVLAEMDAAVGDLVAAAGPNAAVVVFSTTVMGANGTLEHLMPRVVEAVNRRLGESTLSLLARKVLRRFGTHRPPPCELLPFNENGAALRINAGRRPGLIDRIQDLLAELVDPETGEAAISGFDRPSDDTSGRRAAALPDLQAHYRSGRAPQVIQSSRLGRIAAPRPTVRPGNHADGGGVVFAAGADPALIATIGSMVDLGPAAVRMLATAPAAMAAPQALRAAS